MTKDNKEALDHHQDQIFFNFFSEDGAVYSFGRNIDGQLGIGGRKESKVPVQISALKEDKICEIACGGDYCLAVSECGSVFSWGNNTNGQLGKPPMDVVGKDSDKVVVMKGTKRIIRLPHSLQVRSLFMGSQGSGHIYLI